QVCRRIWTQADVFAFIRFVAQQHTEVPHIRQGRAYLLEAANAEICSSNIDLLTGLVLEDVVQHIGQTGLDIVDDVGNSEVIIRHKVLQQGSRPSVSYLSGCACTTAV